MESITRTQGAVSLKVLMTPQDLNHHGTVFGGAILAYFDLAGSNYAMTQVGGKVVQIAVKDAAFKLPAYENECLTFYARTAHTGNTSITVDVEAWRSKPASPTPLADEMIAQARIVYVKVDARLQPTPIKRDTLTA